MLLKHFLIAEQGTIIQWMESFGNIPPEKLDEAMEKMSDANVKSFSKIMTNSSIGIVVSSILISALVALFTKRQPAEFE